MHDNGMSAAAAARPERRSSMPMGTGSGGDGIRDPPNSSASKRITYFARSTIVVATPFRTDPRTPIIKMPI